MTVRTAGLLLALVAALDAAAAAAAQLAPDLLPMSLGPVVPPSIPAPLAPPINPGYAGVPPSGLSPLLTQPGPVYQLPPLPGPSYPPQQLPGPIDQQKLQSYRNNLLGQQWQMQRQGVSPGSEYSRELQQQLNAPDPQ